MRTIINRLFIVIIKFYRVAISPFLPPSCRFYPTCSTYALEAFQKHPWYKALFLSVRRVSKCHPWHEGGYDPVPDPTDAGLKHG